MSKPKEFWINIKPEETFGELDWHYAFNKERKNSIHVIEHSAYEKLKEQQDNFIQTIQHLGKRLELSEQKLAIANEALGKVSVKASNVIILDRKWTMKICDEALSRIEKSE
jgi:hypothetical protein